MKLVLATTLWARLTGLLIKNRCNEHEVLLLAPCKSIHSFGMTTALDVAFIDANASVLAVERNLPRGKIRSHAQAVAVLERRSCPQRYWPKPGERLRLDSSTIVR